MSDSLPKSHLNGARGGMTRRYFLAAGMAAVAGSTFYGNEIGRHEIEVVERTFTLRRLPGEFAGMRVVQLSDIHLDQFTEEWFFERVIQRVNQLQPDMVLLTGDYITRGPEPQAQLAQSAQRCANMIAELRTKVRYGILGNHDFAMNTNLLRGMMAAAGTTLLVNQTTTIRRGSAQFLLTGLDDWTYSHPDLSAALPGMPDNAVLLMVHEPDYADVLAKHPLAPAVSLVLSGHTHGGQVRLPGLPPIALPPLGRIYPHGLYQVQGLQLYVNRGVGTVGVPMRLNCPPEITVLTLQPE